MLLALLALCLAEAFGEYHSYSHQKYLRSGESAALTNALHPSAAPPSLRESWMITTSPDSFIRLSCLLIDLPKNGNSCGENAFIVADGMRTQEICGRTEGFMTDSMDSTLLSFLRTGPIGGGVVQCTVLSVPRPETEETTVVGETTTESKWAYLDVKSEEIDSSEHGGPPGKIPTNCSCGWANKGGTSRIFGGKETDVNEFPWMAGLSFQFPRHIFCGATLITHKHAITAAQCTHKKTSPLALVVGEHDKRTESSTTQAINILTVIEHENFSPSKFLNDIALLVLEKNIDFTKLIGPVCLPTKPMKLEKKYVKALGWGKTSWHPYGSNVLMKVNLRVVPKSTCFALRPDMVPEGSPNQICTYARRKSTCSYGDQGGPIVWLDPDTNRFTLVGIISYGTTECGTGIPRVNTDITSFISWIQAKIKVTDGSEKTCSRTKK